MKSNLYFLAILLPSEISEQITTWKMEMAEKYGARHALKSPPHLTLQMPFKKQLDGEPEMITKLNSYANNQSAMNIHLSGFGCFSPKVIYVDVVHPEPLIKRFESLQEFLKDELHFSQDELSQRFHPHITIATRDLRKKVFSEAWSDFKNRNYQTVFMSDGLTLLKYNDKFWEVFQMFRWG